MCLYKRNRVEIGLLFIHVWPSIGVEGVCTNEIRIIVKRFKILIDTRSRWIEFNYLTLWNAVN